MRMKAHEKNVPPKAIRNLGNIDRWRKCHRKVGLPIQFRGGIDAPTKCHRSAMDCGGGKVDLVHVETSCNEQPLLNRKYDILAKSGWRLKHVEACERIWCRPGQKASWSLAAWVSEQCELH